jgi:hypothetical protein
MIRTAGLEEMRFLYENAEYPLTRCMVAPR